MRTASRSTSPAWSRASSPAGSRPTSRSGLKVSSIKQQHLQGIKPFPSVDLGFDNDAVKRAFFSTSAAAANVDHSFGEGDRRVGRAHTLRAQGDRTRFSDPCLTNPNHWKPKAVPGFGRQECSYTKDFITRASIVDREKVPKHKIPCFPSFEGETTFKEFFKKHDKAQLEKQTNQLEKSCNPEKWMHVDLNSKSGETRSAFQMDFDAHGRALAERLRGELLEPVDATRKIVHHRLHGQSTHQREFTSSTLNFERKSEYPHTRNPVHQENVFF